MYKDNVGWPDWKASPPDFFPHKYRQNTIQHGIGSEALTGKPFTHQWVMGHGSYRYKDSLITGKTHLRWLRGAAREEVLVTQAVRLHTLRY